MCEQTITCARYFKDIHRKRVFMLGLIPPPFGGVSVHVQRVSEKLAQNNSIHLFDVIKEYQKRSRIGYSIFLLRQLWRFKPDIIYYHTLFLRNSLAELFLLIFYARVTRAKLDLVEHSTRFLYQRSRVYIFFLNRLMRLVNKQILIGTPMLKAYHDNGVILRNYEVESSFVPPDITQDKDLYAQYPRSLHDFIAQNKFVMLMNASKFGLWNGQDIYGFDLCIQLIHDLKSYDVSLIIAAGTIYDHKHYELIRQQLHNNPRVYFLIDYPHELWPLIKRVNLFLRPSRYDNCSVSVLEAAWFGVPIIASDVTERPKETQVFKTGDYAAFLNCVQIARTRSRTNTQITPRCQV